MQRKDNELLEHGLETGIVKQLPSGEFTETHRPPDEKRAVIEAKEVPALMPPPGSQDKRGVPSPASRGA